MGNVIHLLMYRSFMKKNKHVHHKEVQLYSDNKDDIQSLVLEISKVTEAWHHYVMLNYYVRTKPLSCLGPVPVRTAPLPPTNKPAVGLQGNTHTFVHVSGSQLWVLSIVAVE